MKLKRILAGALAAVVTISTVAVASLSTVSAEDSDVMLYVTADTETAYVGEEITYTLSIVPPQQLGTFDITLDMPEGLTYVANSFEISSTAADELGWNGDGISWAEKTILNLNGFPLSATFTDFTAGQEIVLGTFKATSTEEAEYTLGFTRVEFTDDFYDILTYDVDVATVSFVEILVDTTSLETAIADAEDVDTSLYTAESVADLTAALENAQTVLADSSSTQDEIDIATARLNSAISGLVANVTTYSVSGTIYVSDEDATIDMTVVAVAADGTETSVTATSMGEYVIEGLEAGTYTITISGGKYAPRSYEVTVSADLAQDVELNPYGDINGDGVVSTADVGLANSHAKNVTTLEDYEFVCADVNLDGSVTTADVGKINSHAKGVSLLW